MRLIIGANGQIAKSIINELPKSEFLFLLTSNKVKLLKFLKEIKKNNNYTIIESDYEKIIFPDIKNQVIPSLLRDFTAPVNLNTDLSLYENIHLLRFDKKHLLYWCWIRRWANYFSFCR